MTLPLLDPGTNATETPAAFHDILSKEDVIALIELIDQTVRSEQGGRWDVTLVKMAKVYGKDLAFRTLQLVMSDALLTQARAQFSEDVYFILQYAVLRYYDPSVGGAFANWHFDANILGPYTRMLNFWIPLVDVGISSPGITLVTPKRAPQTVWQHLENVVAKDGRITDANRKMTLYADKAMADEIEKDESCKLITPVIPAGGALVFDQQTLHRTQFLTQGMTPRYSFEVRVVPESIAADLQRQTGFTFISPEFVTKAS